MDSQEMDRAVKLVRRLLWNTQTGEASWGETDDATTFAYGGANAAVTIDRFDGRSGKRTMLRVLNARGTEVDIIDIMDNDLEYLDNPLPGLLADLHTAARRSALDTDQVYKDLLEGLEEEF